MIHFKLQVVYTTISHLQQYSKSSALHAGRNFLLSAVRFIIWCVARNSILFGILILIWSWKKCCLVKIESYKLEFCEFNFIQFVIKTLDSMPNFIQIVISGVHLLSEKKFLFLRFSFGFAPHIHVHETKCMQYAIYESSSK